MRSHIRPAALFFATALATVAPAAAASVDSYVARVCASGCADPAAERAAAEETWASLQAMGTTQFAGWEADGILLDDATMIAGARSMGATEFDRYVRSGSIPGGDRRVLETARDRMSEVAPVGGPSQGLSGSGRSGGRGQPMALANSEVAATYCDPAVAQVQVAAAEARIDNQVQLASSDLGFSRLGGNSAGPHGAGNTGSFASMTCLERLMNSGSDIFFRPPSLSDLISNLENFVCGKAESIYLDATAPLNQGIYETVDLGGFYPGLRLSGLSGGMNVRVRPGMGSAGEVNIRSPQGRVGIINNQGNLEVPRGAGLSDLYR